MKPAWGTLLVLGAVLSQPVSADDVNARDAQGRTLLLRAVYDNDLSRVRALLKAGADPNLFDDLHDTPFLYAGAEGRTEILKLLIPVSDHTLLNRYGGTALIPAAHHGHPENVRLLLEQTKIYVNHVNNPGWTALLEAVILGDGSPKYQEIVRLLLAHGADPRLADSGGVTPLTHARQRGFAPLVRLLEAAQQ